MEAKIAVIISNYNTPERADALADFVRERSDAHVIVVDNGSAGEKPANTAVALGLNVRLTHSYLMGLAYCDALAATSGREYDGYWFLTTSLAFDECDGDPVEILWDCMERTGSVYVSPTYRGGSRWPHIMMSGAGKSVHIGGVGMYRADWFNRERFDPRLTYNWGTDFDASIRAIHEGVHGWVCDGLVMDIHENIGYREGKHGMSVDQYHALARAEMDRVMTEKHPRDWPIIRDTESYVGVIARRYSPKEMVEGGEW